MKISRSTLKFYIVAALNTLTGLTILGLGYWILGEKSRELQIIVSWLATVIQGYHLSKNFVWPGSGNGFLKFAKYFIFALPTLIFSLLAFVGITLRTSASYILVHLSVSLIYSVLFLLLNNAFTFRKSKFRIFDV